MPNEDVTLLKPHAKDLGGFQVRRLLPAFPTKMVGPFIFFDHMGPASFAPGTGIDVRPHPHIGLATVTYLFEGALLHRDSLGTVQRIEPGDVNWMTAGQGIAHSERTAPEDRNGSKLHGIQTWVALPRHAEEVAPAFSHHPKDALPEIAFPGATLRLVAGSAFGRHAPTPTYSGMFYLGGELSADAAVELADEHEERAVYVVDGEVSVDGRPIAAQHLAVLPPKGTFEIRARSPARVMLLGGERMDGDRFIWWNFVSSSREAIEDAKARWREGRFPSVPGETEFIPLPER